MRTPVNNTLLRIEKAPILLFVLSHGNGSIILNTVQAVAWGIEPRLALDKKTHDALRCDDAASGAPPLASSCLGGGGLTGAWLVENVGTVWV